VFKKLILKSPTSTKLENNDGSINSSSQCKTSRTAGGELAWGSIKHTILIVHVFCTMGVMNSNEQ